MNKKHLHHLWLILAAYGVWFAIFSGLEEISKGKYYKVILSFVFGGLVYLWVEKLMGKHDKN